MNRNRRSTAVLIGLTLLGATGSLAAQGSTPLAVGQTAPDFALPGARSGGPLPEPVRLSDLRGQTVVIAFFYKARTKG